MTPDDVGLRRCKVGDLIGGNPKFNSKETRKLLNGAPGPYRDIVVLNAAAALVVAGTANNLQDGVSQAISAIDSGRASRVLTRVIEITNRSL